MSRKPKSKKKRPQGPRPAQRRQEREANREIIEWLTPGSLAEIGHLMATASLLRQEAQGDAVEFCAIVNARSGRCSEDCSFCAQSALHHTQAEVYPLMEAEEIVDRGRAAAAAGAVRFGIVTSGRACPEGPELDNLCRAVERLRAERIILPCASLGLLKQDQAERLASAGLVRYHHNLETGPSFFPQVCTTHSYQDRAATIITARDAGLEVCVCGIVGLGETPQQRLEFFEALAGFLPESVPLNFLNPIAGTRLEKLTPMTAPEALAAIAVCRLVLPMAHIRTCGGREQVLGRLAPLMYLAGAGATMIGDYLTTQGGQPNQDLADLKALGLRPAALDDLLAAYDQEEG
ncbi:MAG: biotin synthase BioB [Desulfarculus sp.]|nr:biotin synthase BioB [Desulfarculus sp.]